MNTSTYQHTPIAVNHQIPQPAANERGKEKFDRQNLELATKNVQLSDREIIIATEPEIVVIIGYAEFGARTKTNS